MIFQLPPGGAGHTTGSPGRARGWGGGGWWRRAAGPEAAEALQHGLLVGGEDALGDLQHQLARVEAGGVEGAGHVLEQVGLLELADRQVHAEERVGLEGRRTRPA
jgi:hypothetical protein